MKIEVDAQALDSLKAMAQRLQDERDELLSILEEGNGLLLAVDQIQVNSPFHRAMKNAIAKCTKKPEVIG